MIPEPEAADLSDVLNSFPEEEQEAVAAFLNMSAKTAGCELEVIVRQAAESLEEFKAAFETWRKKNQAAPPAEAGSPEKTNEEPPNDQGQPGKGGELPLGGSPAKGAGNGNKSAGNGKAGK